MFLGFVPIETTLPLVVLAKGPGNTPVNLDSLPWYRCYGPSGLMPLGTGTLGYKDSKSISSASAAAPIVVASASHGLTTGNYVTVSGSQGLAGLNGTFQVSVVDGDHFSLNGSSGTGSYTGGGVWNVTGLYGGSLLVGAASGYGPGGVYAVTCGGTIGGASWGDLHTFCVV